MKYLVCLRDEQVGIQVPSSIHEAEEDAQREAARLNDLVGFILEPAFCYVVVETVKDV